MNREELIRIVVWQYAFVCVVAAVAWLGWSLAAGLSALAGGLCVAVPNSIFALNLIISQMTRKPMRPSGVIVGEFLKMIVICCLFAAVAKFFSGLNWPAMLAGIIAAVFGQFGLIFNKH